MDLWIYGSTQHFNAATYVFCRLVASLRLLSCNSQLHEQVSSHRQVSRVPLSTTLQAVSRHQFILFSLTISPSSTRYGTNTIIIIIAHHHPWGAVLAKRRLWSFERPQPAAAAFGPRRCESRTSRSKSWKRERLTSNSSTRSGRVGNVRTTTMHAPDNVPSFRSQ